MRALALATVTLAIAGCGAPAELAVTDAAIRLPAAPGRPGAAYFTIRGGQQAETLVAARSTAANRAELHESSMAGGMMRMAPIRDVPVPAGGIVKFESGGKHVMLFDMNPTLRPGQTARITLQFASGKSIEADARLLAPGETMAH